MQLKLREDGLMDLNTWMIVSTSVRATPAAAGSGNKGGSNESLDHVLGNRGRQDSLPGSGKGPQGWILGIGMPLVSDIAITP